MKTGWTDVVLGDVASSRLGKMLSPASKSGALELPYLGNAEVRWGSLRLDALRTMTFSEKEQEEFSLRRGDVLICEGGEVGRTAVIQRDLPGVHFQKALHRVRCSPLLDPHFLFRYMEFAAPSGRLDDYSSEATIRHLTGVKLRQLPIPLPPIEEQRRIAAVLDAADALRAKRRHAIAKLDTLTQAIFIDMFGDPTGDLTTLGSVCETITKGTTPTSIGLEFVASGIPFVRVQDLVGGIVDGDCELFVSSATHAKLERSQLHPGDVLVSIAGTIGRVATVGTAAPAMNCNQAVALMRPDSKLIRSEWLAPYLRTRAVQDRFIGRKVTGTISNLSLSQLRDTPVPIVPVSEQKRFAHAVATLGRTQLEFAADLSHLNDLFASLQQRAFRGEL